MKTRASGHCVIREYIHQQVNEMEKHKWLESEKAGFDLGQKALLDWVDKYYEKFSKAYFSGKFN
jgi:hypothetical protein